MLNLYNLKEHYKIVMSSYTKDTAITFITRIISLILGIVTSIIIARLLGPENKGIYTMAALLPQLIVTIADLGIGPATVYYVTGHKSLVTCV